MAIWQTGEHRDLELLAQPVHDRVELKTRIMAVKLVVRERAQHNGFLVGQNAGMQPLGQHALDAVWVFGQIFQIQNQLSTIIFLAKEKKEITWKEI